MHHPPGLQRRTFIIGPALGLLLCVPCTAAAESAFVIMSEQEMATHRAAMATLSGSAREAYRNARYTELRQRAIENGFQLPATPPWTPLTTLRVDEAAARHAVMREKLEARRLALQPSETETPTALPGDEGTMTRPQEAATAASGTRAGPAPGIDTRADVPIVSRDETPPPGDSAAPADVPVTAAAAEQAVVSAAPERITTAASAQTSPSPAPPAARNAPVDRPVQPAPPVRPPSPRAPAPAVTDTPVEPSAGASSTADTMAGYREKMRARFDEFLRERQAQQDEVLRRQREQHEGRVTQHRPRFPSGPRVPVYPYPGSPAYGPRQPPGYPAYRSPYWVPPR